MLKRIGRPFSFLLVLVSVLALVGCGTARTVTADEVVQNALAAQAGVTSNYMRMDIELSAKGTMSGTSIDAKLTGALTSDIDWQNKKMSAQLGMTIKGQPLPFEIQMSTKMFAVDNYTYTQTTMLGITDNWTKSALPVDFWATMDNTQLITSILQSTQAELLKDEKVGGITCHVLKLTPDIAAIQAMMGQQFPGEQEMPELKDLINSLSFKVWVDKDTSYITQAEIILTAQLTSQALGNPAGNDNLTVTLKITMQSSKFNKPVSIDLPAEALNAPEGEFEIPLIGMFGM